MPAPCMIFVNAHGGKRDMGLWMCLHGMGVRDEKTDGVT